VSGPVRVKRVDEERRAFPVPDAIAHPAASRAMRPAVKRHDTRVVNHLVEDDDVVLRLDQLHIVVSPHAVGGAFHDSDGCAVIAIVDAAITAQTSDKPFAIRAP
jgi:hypothetical protein